MRLFLIVALATACFCAGPVRAQEFWGAQLPDFGGSARIIGLYRSPTGAVVMKFIAGPRGEAVVDYYDTALKKRLAPDSAREVARNNAVQSQVEAALRLSPIPSHLLSPITNSAGTVFGTRDASSSRCGWPYDAMLTIMGAGPTEYEQDFLLLWKRPHPETQTYGCRYVDTPARPKLSTHYGWDLPLLYWSSGPDVYAVFGDRYLVRFDAAGRTRFFDQRTDVLMVNAGKISPLIDELNERNASGNADSANQARLQRIVAQMEAVIAGVARARIPAR